MLRNILNDEILTLPSYVIVATPSSESGEFAAALLIETQDKCIHTAQASLFNWQRLKAHLSNTSIRGLHNELGGTLVREIFPKFLGIHRRTGLCHVYMNLVAHNIRIQKICEYRHSQEKYWGSQARIRHDVIIAS